MKRSFFLVFLIIPFISNAQLTGIWIDDLEQKYRIRQVDNNIFWSLDANPRVYNVFHGVIAGDIITGKWADVPDGEKTGNGTLALKVENPDRMVKIASSGNYGGSVWIRGGSAISSGGGGGDPNNPVTLPEPKKPTSTSKAIKIPGAVDLAISSTDIWIGHGEWGVYKVPLSTRKPQSYSSDKMVTRITVDQNNAPWIIDTNNEVYYHNGSTWINTNSGKCKDICIDKYNKAWVIDYGWMLKYFDRGQNKWIGSDKHDGRALAVIDENNILHANYYMKVHQKKGGPWKEIPGIEMDDLAMSPNGRMWGKSRDSRVYEYKNGKWEEHIEYGKALRIAVDPSGEAYTIKIDDN